MSVARTVFLKRARLPRAQGVNAGFKNHALPLVIDASVDLATHSGAIPCVFKGRATSFEFVPEAAAAKEIDDDLREELDEAVGDRDLAVGLVAHDADSAAAALITAGVICEISGGILFDDESAGIFSPDEAIALARDEVL